MDTRHLSPMIPSARPTDNCFNLKFVLLRHGDVRTNVRTETWAKIIITVGRPSGSIFDISGSRTFHVTLTVAAGPATCKRNATIEGAKSLGHVPRAMASAVSVRIICSWKFIFRIRTWFFVSYFEIFRYVKLVFLLTIAESLYSRKKLSVLLYLLEVFGFFIGLCLLFFVWYIFIHIIIKRLFGK